MDWYFVKLKEITSKSPITDYKYVARSFYRISRLKMGNTKVNPTNNLTIRSFLHLVKELRKEIFSYLDQDDIAALLFTFRLDLNFKKYTWMDWTSSKNGYLDRYEIFAPDVNCPDLRVCQICFRLTEKHVRYICLYCKRHGCHRHTSNDCCTKNEACFKKSKQE